MRRRTLCLVVASALAAAVAIPAGASAATPTKPKVKITLKASFVPNRYTKESLRYDKDVYPVKSGSTVTLIDKSQDIHSLTIVKKSDLPRTLGGIDKCFEAFCGQLFGQHAFAENPEGPPGPPANPVVNVGKEGLNTRGDSVVVLPSKQTTFKVTASKGRTLRFMCIIHPQMQAKFSVK